MGINYNPAVVSDGLIAYYDIGNSKSWRGPPITNLVTNGDFANGTSGFSSYFITPTIATSTEVPRTLGITRNVLECNTSAVINGGGNYGGFSFDASSLAQGSAYTLTFYARTLSGSFIMQVSHQSGSGDETNLSSSFNITNQWTLYRKSVTSLDLNKPTIYMYNFNPPSVIFQVADIQIENSQFASPFVLGSRNSSNIILDITKNSSFTPQSLTYGDNNFSFNGSTNYMTTSFLSSIANSSNYSISMWCKLNSLSGEQRLFSSSGAGTFTIRFSGGDFTFHYNPFDGSPASTQTSATGITYNTTNYYNITVTNSSTNGARLYVNGELKGTEERAVNIPIGATGYIGCDSTQTLFANTVISVFNAYNKELSALEVEQNFAALRGRYGV